MIHATNFQRVGEPHNAGVGRDFEDLALNFFYARGIGLYGSFSVPIGVAERKKTHRFDLGSEDPAVIVECKSHTWTLGGNMPSAKLTLWNEAMYYFHIAPKRYRKILFVLKHLRGGVSLAAYYLQKFAHLVPDDVEVWEFDVEAKTGERLR
jgi:hypothetical protein